MLKPYGSRDGILWKKGTSVPRHTERLVYSSYSEVFKVYYRFTEWNPVPYPGLSSQGPQGLLEHHVLAPLWSAPRLMSLEPGDTWGAKISCGTQLGCLSHWGDGRFFPASPPSRERTLSTAVKMKDRGANLGFVSVSLQNEQIWTGE